MRRKYCVDFGDYSYTLVSTNPLDAAIAAIALDLEKCDTNEDSDERFKDILSKDTDVYELGDEGFDDSIPFVIASETICEKLV